MHQIERRWGDSCYGRAEKTRLVDFGIDHDALASAITDGFVDNLNREVEEDEISCCHVLLGHVTPICCVAICTKLDVVVSGFEDGSICVHNIRSGEFIRSLHIDAATSEVQESCARDAIPVKLLEIHLNGSFVAHLEDGSLNVISLNGQEFVQQGFGGEFERDGYLPRQ